MNSTRVSGQLFAGFLTLFLALLGSGFAQKPIISPQSIIVNPVDPALEVRVSVDKPGENPAYTVGDRIRITTSVNQDAYVYLFSVHSDGEIDLILPNRLSGGGNFLRANETRTFPAANAGFNFVVNPPAGQDKVLALASKRELNLNDIATFKSGQSFAQVNVNGQTNLARALSIVVEPLPTSDWVSAVAFFQVRGAVTTPPPPATGTLNVDGTPRGADVFLDGAFVGNLPTTISTTLGRHTVEVREDGFSPFSTTLTVAAGTQRLNVTLNPIVVNGTLNINTNPRGADVFLDGAFVGRSPVTVTTSIGRHTVEAREDGYRNASTVVNVTAGTQNLNLNLEPVVVNGTVIVDGGPRGANVFLDGVFAGNLPVTLNTSIGRHSLEVRADGFENFATTINVAAGTQRVNVNLTQIVREGTLVVFSNVANARVFINGNEVGRINANLTLTVGSLPAGNHELVVIAPGFGTAISRFDIRAGQTTQANAQLVR
jgi:hypothetical protein